ncbi:MAG: hypothetical protein NUV88_00360 [Candidatus Kaiserbacteria bacterium]|nr:hypothetical protein [Candidatus Kaiserbacteria bacterium]
MSFITHNKWMLIGLGVLVAGILWYMSSGSSPSRPILSTDSGGASSPAEQSVVHTLLTLRAVTLSGTILSDPAFQSLQDFGTQIIPEPIGRSDPFAPLSSVSSAQSSNSTTKGAPLFKPAGTR